MEKLNSFSIFIFLHLCARQSIFALRDIILNSLTLPAYLTSAYASILFSLHRQHSRSSKQSFYLEVSEKIPVLSLDLTGVFVYMCMSVCMYVCVYHTCVCMSRICLCICISCVHVLSLWNHQHFHGTVQRLRNTLVSTSWYSKLTTIPACLICLFLSHSASKLREEWLERKTENGVGEPCYLKARNALTEKRLLKNSWGFLPISL